MSSLIRALLISFAPSAWQEDYDDIVNGWNAKLKRSSAGEQRWGLFIATK